MPSIARGRPTASRDAFWPDAARHPAGQVGADLHRPAARSLGTLIVGVSLDAPAGGALQDADQQRDRVRRERRRSRPPRFPKATWPALAPLLRDARASRRRSRIDGNEYIALTQAARRRRARHGAADRALILRSRTERLRFLRALHTRSASPPSWPCSSPRSSATRIARTVTRPLGAITATMREMAASGDLTRRIPVPADGRWQDEDARLLATTFNSMTDSIAALPARGGAARAAVVARPAVDGRRARDPQPADDHQDVAADACAGRPCVPSKSRRAAHDIDEEIARLNRIVSEVLDFAGPIKFELAPADLNALATDAVRAAATDGPRPSGAAATSIRAIPEATTDAGAAAAGPRQHPRQRHPGGRGPRRGRRPARRAHPAARPPDSTASAWPSWCPTAGRASRRRPAPRLRSLLHDPADRNRHRSCNLPKHHRRTGRTDHRREPAGSRHGGAHRAAAPLDSRMTANGSILLVDDEAKIRNALAQALREEGHEVRGDREPARGAAAARRAACSTCCSSTT